MRPQLDVAQPPHADISRGVFETLLVLDGRALRVSRHLERLAASARLLYGAELPADLAAHVESVAAGHDLARLRIDLVPQRSSPARVEIALSALEQLAVSRPAEAALVTVGVAGGPGAHKLADRSWLGQIEALAGPDVRPLLVSRSGELLETTRANVFLLRGGALATPPLDGSILPGVVRAAVLEHAASLGIVVRELPLTLERLHEADMVALSGSLRLLELARVRGGGRRSAQAAARLLDALTAGAVRGTVSA